MDGTLIIDSATLLKRGQLSRHEPNIQTGDKVRTKNFWTRLRAWMIDRELPVYKEIGNGNGKLYPEVVEALSGTTTAMLLLNDKGEQIVSTAVPIKRGSTVQGVLLMSTPPGEIDQILSEEHDLILLLAFVALTAAVVSSFLLAQTVAGPMRRLSEAAYAVSRNISGRQDLPDYSGRNDEVGQLAAAFSEMTAALYRRAEASESFAADVAHELKNPLTAARSIAESLGYAKSEEQRNELVRQIQNELKRLNRLITDVSNASRLDAELARQQMAPTEVTAVAMSIAQIFRDILTSDTRASSPSSIPPPSRVRSSSTAIQAASAKCSPISSTTRFRSRPTAEPSRSAFGAKVRRSKSSSKTRGPHPRGSPLDHLRSLLYRPPCNGSAPRQEFRARPLDLP